jgi:hypothetical protein
MVLGTPGITKRNLGSQKERKKMTFPVNDEFLLKYVYKKSVDGDTGAISLRSDPNDIKEGLLVKGVEVRFKKALTGATALTLGNTADPDGYLADFNAQNADNGVVNEGEFAGDLIWDNINKNHTYYRVGSAVNVQDLVLTITGTVTEDLAELEIYLKCSNDL